MLELYPYVPSRLAASDSLSLNLNKIIYPTRASKSDCAKTTDSFADAAEEDY